MGALPRPDLPPGGQRDLSDALHDLHHRAGWPSLRALARDAGCSHTTVSKVFSTPAPPTWGVLELLVEAMRGDTTQFHELWLAASSPAADGTGEDPTSRPRIAGRRAELAVVRRHLTSGTGLLLVAGEAGIGKTRLVTAAAALVADDTFVATGSCLPLSSEVPLLPVADALRTIHAPDGGQWLKEALAECAAYVPSSLRRVLPELDVTDVVPEREDEWSRQRLFVAVGSALAALASQRPLAVLLEDLHWADSATLDLLEHILLTRPDAVSMVGTWRADDPATKSSSTEWWERVQRLPMVDVMELSPLSRDETAEQLAMLTSSAPDPAWVDRIHSRTRGQPLFTEQLTAHATSADQMPRLLADLLDRRLEGLSDTAWPVVRALGVADRPLTDAQIRAITTLASEELNRDLRELGDRRLLAAPARPHQVQLRHPLLADAIRQRLVAGEASAEHHRLATVLAASPNPSPAEIATHWRAAGDAEQEVLWRIRAARAASSRYAARQAALEWLRVLELWPESGVPGEVELSLSDVYRAAVDEFILAGDRAQAAALGTEAMNRLPDLDGLEAAELHRLTAIGLGHTDLPAALALVSNAVTLYEEGPPSPGLVRGLELQSHYLRTFSRWEEARAAIARAVEVSTALDNPSLQRRAMMGLAWHDLVTGEPERAVARAKAATQLTPPAPDPVDEIVIAIDHTDILLIRCAPAEEVAEVARPGLEFAEWEIAPSLVSVLRSNLAQALTDAGQIERSAALLDPVTSGEVSRNSWAVHLERAHLDVARGQVKSAKTRLEALAALPHTSDEMVRWFEHHAALADLWDGRPQRALDRTVHALADADATTLTFWGSLFLLAARAAADLAQPSAAAGGRTELQQQLHQLKAAATVDPFGPRSPAGDRTASGYTWNAELARLDGTQSVEHWVAAAAEWDKLTRPHHAAYCRWRAAQVALANGQATLATRLLRRAAHEARAHVPLSSGIQKTAEGVGRARPRIR